MPEIEKMDSLICFLDDTREGLEVYLKEEPAVNKMNFASKAVFEKIQNAFHGVTCYGEKYVLLAGEAEDDYLPEEELDVLANLEERNSWQNIPPLWLYTCGASLSFVGPEAFRFLIPAYMCAALQFHFNDGRAFEFHIGDSIDKDDNIIQYEMQQACLLTDEQKNSISYYLRHMYCQDNHIDELNVSDIDNLYNQRTDYTGITLWGSKEFLEKHTNNSYSSYMNNLLSEYIKWIREKYHASCKQNCASFFL